MRVFLRQILGHAVFGIQTTTTLFRLTVRALDGHSQQRHYGRLVCGPAPSGIPRPIPGRDGKMLSDHRQDGDDEVHR